MPDRRERDLVGFAYAAYSLSVHQSVLGELGILVLAVDPQILSPGDPQRFGLIAPVALFLVEQMIEIDLRCFVVHLVTVVAGYLVYLAVAYPEHQQMCR